MSGRAPRARAERDGLEMSRGCFSSGDRESGMVAGDGLREIAIPYGERAWLHGTMLAVSVLGAIHSRPVPMPRCAGNLGQSQSWVFGAARFPVPTVGPLRVVAAAFRMTPRVTGRPLEEFLQPPQSLGSELEGLKIQVQCARQAGADWAAGSHQFSLEF
ncbi:uncharacterized protein VTP21DRAFT_4735 [Calcarisporiella thermophila]|uniref:uncharacterized protein n=1 Tax=Calcarisporiella thermophila TaxID=911321 RepID=UPI003743BD75